MITIIENFTPRAEEVRESVLQAGFGTWLPSKGEVGSSVYEGMGFVGKHALMLHALSFYMGAPVYPNAMFFRSTNLTTESAYVHSDRESGDYTCIVYLSDHQDAYGTGFYRHRRNGWTHMPSFDELREIPEVFEQLKVEMVRASDEDWELMDFVRGAFNRAVIFDAPRFHARIPNNGFGLDARAGRLVWACHFKTRIAEAAS